jgi:hypothetical protein
VEGQPWPDAARITRIGRLTKDQAWLRQLSPLLAGYKGVDGQLDGLWTCRRGKQVFVFNSTAKAVPTKLAGERVEVVPYTILVRPALP